MKNAIGTFEAKTNFAKLMQRVSLGEEFLITKRWNPIARITPLEKNTNEHLIKNAIGRIKKLSEEMQLEKFDWHEWKLYKDIGKK